MKEIKKHKILLFIIFIALLLRVFKFNDIVAFDSDQEFYAWEAKKILVDHKFTLIGIPTQLDGIFIGPLFTYYSTIFFSLFNGSPHSVNIATVVVNLLTIPLAYFIGKKMFGLKVGLVAALIVAFSKSIAMDGYAGWPVTPILGTTFIFLYFLNKFLDGDQKYIPLIFITIAVGLNWHVMAGFYLFVFLVAIPFYKKKPSFIYTFLGVIAFLLVLSPLIFFDLRHGFLNTKNILSLFQNNNQGDFVLINSFKNVVSVAFNNSRAILFPNPSIIASFSTLAIFISFIYISLKNIKDKISKILLLFFITVLLSASAYKGHISDQYLAPLGAVFILIVSIVISKLPKKFAIILVVLFAFINLLSLYTFKTSLNLKNKQDAVSYIIEDSQDKKFILHIDSGHGQGSGFKYIFYNLKKEPSESGDHLYLISTPWSKKELTTTSLVINNYKAENAKYVFFGDVAVIKIY